MYEKTLTHDVLISKNGAGLNTDGTQRYQLAVQFRKRVNTKEDGYGINGAFDRIILSYDSSRNRLTFIPSPSKKVGLKVSKTNRIMSQDPKIVACVDEDKIPEGEYDLEIDDKGYCYVVGDEVFNKEKRASNKNSVGHGRSGVPAERCEKTGFFESEDEEMFSKKKVDEITTSTLEEKVVDYDAIDLIFDEIEEADSLDVVKALARVLKKLV